jgi:tripartite ATP-independent transporter DctM subunit
MESGMELVGLYLFLPFLICLMLGVPIAFSLGLASTFFLFFSGTRIPPLILVTQMYGGIDSFALLALPMFVLTGELLNRLNLTERLIDVARLLVGWIKGGLAHVNVVTSMFFAGISGSVLADAASIGPILIPAMVRERYPAAFSAAITASSAVIGAIIPPSIPLIIVGGSLQISIGGLFAAGVIPGILIGSLLMLVSFFFALFRGYGDVHKFEGVSPVAKGTIKALPVLMIPILILYGILGGVMTPTEAGAAAALYSIILGSIYGLFYGEFSFDKLQRALIGTARVTGSSLIIVGAAIVFGQILIFHQFPQELLKFLLAITENRFVLFLIIVGFFLFVGTFMDAIANMIILGPLLMPVALQGLGMHEIQYGMFLMIGLLLGVITPPLGIVLFIVSPIAKVSIERVSIAVIPFLLAELAVLAMIAFIPAVTLAIPRMSGLVQ